MERGKKDFLKMDGGQVPSTREGTGGDSGPWVPMCVQPAHGRCPSVRCKVRQAEVWGGDPKLST